METYHSSPIVYNSLLIYPHFGILFFQSPRRVNAGRRFVTHHLDHFLFSLLENVQPLSSQYFREILSLKSYFYLLSILQQKIYLILYELSVNIQRIIRYLAVYVPSKTTRLVYQIATDICGISLSLLNVVISASFKFKHFWKLRTLMTIYGSYFNSRIA